MDLHAGPSPMSQELPHGDPCGEIHSSTIAIIRQNPWRDRAISTLPSGMPMTWHHQRCDALAAIRVGLVYYGRSGDNDRFRMAVTASWGRVDLSALGSTPIGISQHADHLVCTLSNPMLLIDFSVPLRISLFPLLRLENPQHHPSMINAVKGLRLRMPWRNPGTVEGPSNVSSCDAPGRDDSQCDENVVAEGILDAQCFVFCTNDGEIAVKICETRYLVYRLERDRQNGGRPPQGPLPPLSSEDEERCLRLQLLLKAENETPVNDLAVCTRLPREVITSRTPANKGDSETPTPRASGGPTTTQFRSEQDATLIICYDAPYLDIAQLEFVLAVMPLSSISSVSERDRARMFHKNDAPSIYQLAVSLFRTRRLHFSAVDAYFCRIPPPSPTSASTSLKRKCWEDVRVDSLSDMAGFFTYVAFNTDASAFLATADASGTLLACWRTSDETYEPRLRFTLNDCSREQPYKPVALSQTLFAVSAKRAFFVVDIRTGSHNVFVFPEGMSISGMAAKGQQTLYVSVQASEVTHVVPVAAEQSIHKFIVLDTGSDAAMSMSEDELRMDTGGVIGQTHTRIPLIGKSDWFTVHVAATTMLRRAAPDVATVAEVGGGAWEEIRVPECALVAPHLQWSAPRAQRYTLRGEISNYIQLRGQLEDGTREPLSVGPHAVPSNWFASSYERLLYLRAGVHMCRSNHVMCSGSELAGDTARCVEYAAAEENLVTETKTALCCHSCNHAIVRPMQLSTGECSQADDEDEGPAEGSGEFLWCPTCAEVLCFQCFFAPTPYLPEC